MLTSSSLTAHADFSWKYERTCCSKSIWLRPLHRFVTNWWNGRTAIMRTLFNWYMLVWLKEGCLAVTIWTSWIRTHGERLLFLYYWALIEHTNEERGHNQARFGSNGRCDKNVASYCFNPLAGVILWLRLASSLYCLAFWKAKKRLWTGNLFVDADMCLVCATRTMSTRRRWRASDWRTAL